MNSDSMAMNPSEPTPNVAIPIPAVIVSKIATSPMSAFVGEAFLNKCLRMKMRLTAARIAMLAMLEPNRSPAPMSGTPSSTALMSVMSSGSEVAAASRREPIQRPPQPVSSAIVSASCASREATKNTAAPMTTRPKKGYERSAPTEQTVQPLAH